MRSTFFTSLFLFGFFSCSFCQIKSTEKEIGDSIYTARPDDKEMNLAIETARSTLGQFQKALLSNKFDKSTFDLKVKFPMPSGGDEHIWITHITYKVGKYFGIVGNIPEDTKKVKLDDKIEINNADITDWFYGDNGVLRGGYTIKVIRSRFSKEERIQFDAELPFKIED